MRRILLVGMLLAAGWVAAWQIEDERAQRELLEARNQQLCLEIDADQRYVERRQALEREKWALEENEPAYARILPLAGTVGDEKLLCDFQDMATLSGVKIVSVSMETKR